MSNKENNPMVPGEYRLAEDEIEINTGREKTTLRVSNTGDRPVQVGSHIHFVEANKHLSFDRKASIGKRLNIASGTAVRFEPGQEMEVELTEIGGNRRVFGLANLTDGEIDGREEEILQKAKDLEFKGAE